MMQHPKWHEKNLRSASPFPLPLTLSRGHISPFDSLLRLLMTTRASAFEEGDGSGKLEGVEAEQVDGGELRASMWKTSSIHSV